MAFNKEATRFIEYLHLINYLFSMACASMNLGYDPAAMEDK